MGQPSSLFVYFCSFQQRFLQKITDYSGNQTQIIGVEGEQADHCTTTTTAHYILTVAA